MTITDHRAHAAVTRDRIIAAASALLASGGRDAVTTRAVCAAAEVQAPTLYRIFGDKYGLLDAVAATGFSEYVREMTALQVIADPVDDLRAGWDHHVGFGLSHPYLYSLMYSEPAVDRSSQTIVEAAEHLFAKVHQIAQAGRLRVSEQRAWTMLYAGGSGTTLMLIGQAESERDLALSVQMREAIIAAIATDGPAAVHPGAVGAAVTLRASLGHVMALTHAERTLLHEWLDRVSDQPS